MLIITLLYDLQGEWGTPFWWDAAYGHIPNPFFWMKGGMFSEIAVAVLPTIIIK